MRFPGMAIALQRWLTSGADDGKFCVSPLCKNLAIYGPARMPLRAGLLHAPGDRASADVHNPFPNFPKLPWRRSSTRATSRPWMGGGSRLAYFNELQSCRALKWCRSRWSRRRCRTTDQLARSGRRPAAGPNPRRRCHGDRGGDRLLPYYPPRFGLQVEWYAANPNFHPIPAGYGLPWGGPEERDIPAPLVFEAEFALAKAQLKTQTPPYEKIPDNAAIARVISRRRARRRRASRRQIRFPPRYRPIRRRWKRRRWKSSQTSAERSAGG